MAMLLEFTPSSFTTEKYDTTIRQLEEAGQGAPAGRLSHVAYGDPNALRVTDVWESREAFEAFGRGLQTRRGHGGRQLGEAGAGGSRFEGPLALWAALSFRSSRALESTLVSPR